MPVITKEVLDRLKSFSEQIPLPLEPMHGWRSSPDEGGHTHCESCKMTISPGDPVVGCYLKYISIVFCPECVMDNPDLMLKWLTGNQL